METHHYEINGEVVYPKDEKEFYRMARSYYRKLEAKRSAQVYNDKVMIERQDRSEVLKRRWALVFALVCLFIFVLIVCAVAATPEYYAGFKSGWSQGWKSIQGQFAIPPIAPIAPVPRIGEDTYEGGYNMGFLMGREAAQ